MSVKPMPEKPIAGGLSEQERGTANRFGGREQRASAPATRAREQPAPAKPNGAPPKATIVPVKPKANNASRPGTPPLAAPDYVDNLVRGVSIDNAVYVLHWNKGGREYTLDVPESWIRRGPGRGVVTSSERIYDNRQEALEAVTTQIINDAGKYHGTMDYVGFWKEDEIPVTAPTMFNEVTAPRVMALIEAKDEQMRQGAREAEEEMKSLAKGMLIGRWLGGAHAAAQASFQAPVVAPRYAVPLNPRGVPPRGTTSWTGPPAAAWGTSTTAAPLESSSGTRPPISGSTSASSAQRGLPAPRVRDTAAANRWLSQQLNVIRDPTNPNRLRFLLEPNPKASGRLDWRTTERETKTGKRQTGRYEGNETGPTIQIGHQGAFAGGAPEQFMIEDADLNQLGGNVIESKGTKAYPVTSYKEAVLIDGVPVDVASALQWERLGLLPPGTVASSPRIAPPPIALPPAIAPPK